MRNGRVMVQGREGAVIQWLIGFNRTEIDPPVLHWLLHTAYGIEVKGNHKQEISIGCSSQFLVRSLRSFPRIFESRVAKLSRSRRLQTCVTCVLKSELAISVRVSWGWRWRWRCPYVHLFEEAAGCAGEVLLREKSSGQRGTIGQIAKEKVKHEVSSYETLLALPSM